MENLVEEIVNHVCAQLNQPISDLLDGANWRPLPDVRKIITRMAIDRHVKSGKIAKALRRDRSSISNMMDYYRLRIKDEKFKAMYDKCESSFQNQLV